MVTRVSSSKVNIDFPSVLCNSIIFCYHKGTLTKMTHTLVITLRTSIVTFYKRLIKQVHDNLLVLWSLWNIHKNYISILNIYIEGSLMSECLWTITGTFGKIQQAERKYLLTAENSDHCICWMTQTNKPIITVINLTNNRCGYYSLNQKALARCCAQCISFDPLQMESMSSNEGCALQIRCARPMFTSLRIICCKAHVVCTRELISGVCVYLAYQCVVTGCVIYGCFINYLKIDHWSSVLSSCASTEPEGFEIFRCQFELKSFQRFDLSVEDFGAFHDKFIAFKS